MKNYRILIPVLLIIATLGSWYMLITATADTTNEYEAYLAQARKYAETGITKYAIENYEEALSMNSTPEIYAEVSEYYIAQGDDSENMSWCEKFLEAYPKEPLAYNCMLAAYVKDEDYESCFDTLSTADKRNVTSEYINSVKSDLAYEYYIDYNSYDDVGIYSNNFCAVKRDDSWGFVNRYGVSRVACKYKEVGVYTQSGFAPVVDSEGDAYFIDQSGDKVMATKDEYNSFGSLSDDILPAIKTDGKYTYLDTDFNELFGNYDFASTFNGGIAAVEDRDVWMLINNSGETISDSYEDIKLDEKLIAYRNERIFVSTGDEKYIMLDGSANQVGSDTFEDAKVFAGEGPTAVKIGGKWKFLKADGSFLSDNEYEDARAFSNGLAAVKIDGKWGFVDENEELVIENTFDDAKDFNEKGSCFVKNGDKWSLLKLYRLNREDS